MVTVHPYYSDPRIGAVNLNRIAEDVLQGPVIPHVSGIQVIKMAAVAFVGIWLFTKFMKGARGGH